jgi:hypothetical protein
MLWSPDDAGTFVKRMTVVVVLSACAAAANAGPREQAKRMHDRIAGVPPSAAVLGQMETEIAGGRVDAAALIAMDNPAFYSVTLKNLVTPWTNREQTVFAPLNDYTATVIGMVRDDLPFNEVLSSDVLYVGNAGLGLPAVSASNNDHYEQIETRGVNLLTGLQRTTQSGVYGTPPAATAGILTTRAAAQSFFIAGTNRAMFRFTLMNYMCRDLEEVQDTSRAPAAVPARSVRPMTVTRTSSLVLTTSATLLTISCPRGLRSAWSVSKNTWYQAPAICGAAAAGGEP